MSSALTPLPQAAEVDRLTQALRQCAAGLHDVVVESSRTTILSRITAVDGEQKVAFFRDVAPAMTIQVVRDLLEG
jgi:hypothetical protein